MMGVLEERFHPILCYSAKFQSCVFVFLSYFAVLSSPFLHSDVGVSCDISTDVRVASRSTVLTLERAVVLKVVMGLIIICHLLDNSW